MVRSLPSWIVVGICLCAILGLLTSNPSLTVECFIIILVVAGLLWSRVESPVLLFAVTMQWLQVATPVVYADLQGQLITETYAAQEINQATWLSLLGIAVLAFGIRISWIGIPAGN